ncbi:hypothetical protein J3E69DRAFT_338376 [Trichoderma sp. SZMC 28015]
MRVCCSFFWLTFFFGLAGVCVSLGGLMVIGEGNGYGNFGRQCTSTGTVCVGFFDELHVQWVVYVCSRKRCQGRGGAARELNQERGKVMCHVHLDVHLDQARAAVGEVQ